MLLVRVAFSNKPTIVLPFAESRAELLREAECAVAHTTRVEQGTRLYDARVAGAHLFHAEGKATPQRSRAVLVLTDDKESP